MTDTEFNARLAKLKVRNTECGHPDCFAYNKRSGVECSALSIQEPNCSFYATEEQHNKCMEISAKWLASHGYENYKDYYDGGNKK